MGLWIGLLLFGGGACFAIGLVYLGVGLLWAKARIQLWLGMLGVLAAAMAFFEAWMYQAPSAEAYGRLFQWQLGVTFAWGAGLMMFVAEYIGGLRRAGIAVALACLAVVFTNALSPHGIVFTRVVELRQVTLPWGERIVMGRGPIDPLWWLLNSAVLLIGVYAVAACAVAVRRKPRLQASLLTLVLGAVVGVGGVGGFLVDKGLVDLPYLLTLPIFLLVLVMSVDLAARVARTFLLSRTVSRARLARDEALAANRAKSTFLTNMSHELRTPLATVVGTADLLLGTELPPHARRHVAVIDTAAAALQAQIEDILDFAKLEAGRLRLEAVDFSPQVLVRDIGDLLAPRAAEKGIDFVIDIDPAVPAALRGDPVRVWQVLLNLAENAVKFTNRGRVEIRVTPVMPTPDAAPSLHFSVRDTGIGISSEDQLRVFETFFQADGSAARHSGGLGLGLSICKELVRCMGGEIGFESEPGAGSTFWLRLPTESAQEPVVEAPAVETTLAAAQRGRFRVLVVDDHGVNRKLASSHLESLGYRASEAADGGAALARLGSAWAGGEPFDAVLMDCQMPELGGYETTRQLRRKESELGAERTLVVAVTAHAMPGEHERCLAAGMDDYLAKPYRGSELAAVLDRWLLGDAEFMEGKARERNREGSAEAASFTSSGAELDEDRAPLLAERLDVLKRLGEQTGRDAIGETVGEYLRSGPRLIAAVRSAYERGEARALAGAAHSLAGLSGLLGAGRLVALLYEIESEALKGNLADLGRRLRKAEEEHRWFRSVLHGLPGAHPGMILRSDRTTG